MVAETSILKSCNNSALKTREIATDIGTPLPKLKSSMHATAQSMMSRHPFDSVDQPDARPKIPPCSYRMTLDSSSEPILTYATLPDEILALDGAALFLGPGFRSLFFFQTLIFWHHIRHIYTQKLWKVLILLFFLFYFFTFFFNIYIA